MRLFAGVDGGQSSTTALVGDERGTVLGRGRAGPADDVGRSAAEGAAAIDAAIDAAARDAGLEGADFERVVVGLSGYDGSRASPPPLRVRATAVVVLHDTDVAHAGAFGGGAGILTIAGTGSAALGVAESGERALAGGWGYLFGDEGSAFWLARRAVSVAMIEEDRGKPSALGAAAIAFFEQPSLRGVQHAIGSGELPRARLASFAAIVCAMAAAGDAAAGELVAEAADALAALAVRVDAQLGPPYGRPLSYHGGLFADPGLLRRWEAAVRARLPGAAVLAPVAGAAEGALILATRPERLAAVAAPAPPHAVASPRTAPVLERLRGRLIVSVQAEEGSPLAAPEAIALLAKVAVRNGAAGLRIEGAHRIAAVRAATGAPIIGIVKRRHPGFEPYITSTIEEIEEAAGAGADVIAFDATRRDRAGGADTRALIAAVAARGLVAMADCSSLDDARAAAVDGADIIATTLAGYTEETRGRPLPAVDIVSALRGEHPFVVCEGGIASPADAAAAFGAGASAIVVGTAITNIDVLVRRFACVVPLHKLPK